MNTHPGTRLASLLTLLALPALLVAQDHSAKHRRYTLVDVGTFGGPNGSITFDSVVLNRRGTLVGGADTNIPAQTCDPFWSAACAVSQAFKLQDGVLTNLGALPGGSNSFATSINASGAIAGISENGLMDPAFGAAFVGTLWKKNGQIVDLGTLGGSFSLAYSINDRGQSAGGAENTIPDPDNLGGALIGLPSPTQWHAVLWQNGSVQDLGTLGDGPDSFGFFVNDRGQVVGMSYTNSTPNPTTGIPTVEPFFWENGRMTDLGTLGGVYGIPTAMNNRGQVAGFSNLEGDQTAHAFRWDRGSLLDLGSLGGSSSFGNWIDDSGEIVGGSFTAGDETFRAFRWKHGHMTNLGSLNGDPCSVAFSSNSKGQVVGNSLSDCDHLAHAFLWENGGPMVDLNDLVPPHPGLLLHEGAFIGEGGEITGVALLDNGESHAFLLIPDRGRNSAILSTLRDEDQADEQTETLTDAASALAPDTQSSVAVGRARLTPEMIAALRARLLSRYRSLGLRLPRQAR